MAKKKTDSKLQENPNPNIEGAEIKTLKSLEITVALPENKDLGPPEAAAIKKIFEAAGAVPQHTAKKVSAIAADIPAENLDTLMASLRDIPEVVVNNELENYFTGLIQAMSQIYQKQDSVFAIHLNTADVELFKKKFSELVSPELANSITIESSDECGLPSLLLRSQVETQWLVDYYRRKGLFNYLQASGCPLLPTAGELKLLYMQEALTAISNASSRKPQIVAPGGPVVR